MPSQTVHPLRNAFRLGHAPSERDWLPPEIETYALHGKGLDDLWQALDQHAEYRSRNIEWHRARQRQNGLAELRDFVRYALNQRLTAQLGHSPIDQALDGILDGRVDIYEATDRLLREAG